MSSSPYINSQTKQYLRKFQLQNLINSSVNSLLKAQPPDPYSYLIGILMKQAQPRIKIKNIQAYQTLMTDSLSFIKYKITVIYLQKQLKIILNNQSIGIVNDQSIIYDSDRNNGKGLLKYTHIINSEIVPKIVGYYCDEQMEIDRVLERVWLEKGVGYLHGVNSVSFGVAKVVGYVIGEPLYRVVGNYSSTNTNNTNNNNIPHKLNDSNLPSIMVNCLQGGKQANSKCKITKFLLVSRPNKNKDPLVIPNILSSIRKTITSGKGGQSALKLSSDGTFICPFDTVSENLKVLEDAIALNNCRQEYGIGLCFNADTLFMSDSKKYQWENPKTPFDNDQMIQYLIKLSTERPSIVYLQDPLASSQLISWKKLKTKIKQSQTLSKNIKIGSRSQKLIPLSLPQQTLKTSLANLFLTSTPQSHPQFTQQQHTNYNSTKIQLDIFYINRALQLKTLSNIIKVHKILNKFNIKVVLHENMVEGYDCGLVDVCVGLGDVYYGMGGINGVGRYERVGKLNRMKEIREQIINGNSGDSVSQ